MGEILMTSLNFPHFHTFFIYCTSLRAGALRLPSEIKNLIKNFNNPSFLYIYVLVPSEARPKVERNIENDAARRELIKSCKTLSL